MKRSFAVLLLYSICSSLPHQSKLRLDLLNQVFHQASASEMTCSAHRVSSSTWLNATIIAMLPPRQLCNELLRSRPVDAPQSCFFVLQLRHELLRL